MIEAEDYSGVCMFVMPNRKKIQLQTKYVFRVTSYNNAKCVILRCIVLNEYQVFFLFGRVKIPNKKIKYKMIGSVQFYKLNSL